MSPSPYEKQEYRTDHATSHMNKVYCMGRGTGKISQGDFA